MTNYVHADASGNILAILSDSIDEIPAGAIALTQAQVDEWNAGNQPRKWINGGFVIDGDQLRHIAGQKIIGEIDRTIEAADLRVAFIYVAWAVGELLEIASADVTALPAAKRNRLIAIRTKAEKLGLAYLAKKQAEADIVAGVDPDAIPIPDVESFEI